MGLQETARIGFKGMEDIHVKGVLNIGVDPQCVPMIGSVGKGLEQICHMAEEC